MKEDRLSTAPCGYLSFDDARALLDVNAEAARLLGYEASTLVGRSLNVLLSPGTRMLLHAHLFPMLASGRRVEELYVGLRTQDGTDLPVLLSAARSARGETFVNEWVFLPMHRRHFFERELLGAQEGAERALLAEREALTKVEQIQSRMALSDRLVVLGTLAAGMAHEISNPLLYISGNLETLDEDLRGLSLRPEQSAEMLDMVAAAREGAERIREIVRNLKSFSRVDESRAVRVDVKRVIDGAERMLRHEVRKRARLDLECESPAPFIKGDEGKLTQVVMNLVLNAAQAFPSLSPANQIRLRVFTDASARVIIEVRDNGPGVPQGIQEHIFEPFFTTKPVGVGTGLGLSICHSIVEGLGGRIDLESEPGQGACFRISFPVYEDKAASA